VLALAAVVAALVPAACGQAPPFHPGPFGAVAYVRDEAVHVVDVSTHRNRVVAHLWLPGYETGVSWSGDGRWLAVGDDLVPAAGGQLCRPFASGTGLYGDDPSLRWSPKGELLAATTAKGVFLIRPGGKPRKLLPAGWSADGFSPGGGRIAAEGPTRAFELWNIAVATGERTLLFRSNAHDGPPGLARWTPDGRWILFWTDTFESGSIAADGLPLLAVPAAADGPFSSPRSSCGRRSSSCLAVQAACSSSPASTAT
jgi:dipeptidyl aminopeptidase/acylaminoacyl peptidase